MFVFFFLIMIFISVASIFFIFSFISPCGAFFQYMINIFFSIIPLSICMFPFSSSSNDRNADTTEILQLNILLQASASESDKPEYFFSNAIQQHFQ